MKNKKFIIGFLCMIAGIILFITPRDRVCASGLPIHAEYAKQVRPDQLYVPLSERRDYAGTSHIKGAAVYNSDWDKYSCYLIYNQLSDEKRLLWDQLDEMCLGYLTGSEDLSDYTEYVKTTLSEKDMLNTAYQFIYLNPQYYFINARLSYFTSGEDRYVALMVYREFQSGTRRAACTRSLKSSVDGIVGRAFAGQSKTEQLRIIHDTIAGMVEYNYFISPDPKINAEEEERFFTQSAYSALCLGYSVCAGYAKAFEMVCNALDIDCIVVTNSDHAWNMVRIDDSWYNMDCTWDDRNGQIYYDYYARNDRYFLETDHTPESDCPGWQEFLPPASRDTGSTRRAPGTFPSPTGVTAAPQFVLTTSAGGELRVAITCGTDGADIYYTTDGSEPSQAASKSCKYRGPFTVKHSQTIRAIAVCDTCLDSEVTDYLVPLILAVPELKAPVNKADAVAVKWTPVAEAEGYYVYRKSKGGSYEQIAVVTGEKTVSYRDTDVHNGTAYVYTVEAYAGDITSGRAKTGQKIVFLSRPSISSATVSGRKLTVKWDKNRKVTGYQISCTTDSATKTITVTDASTLSKTIASLNRGDSCKIRVRSYKTVGGVTYYSAWSKAKNVAL